MKNPVLEAPLDIWRAIATTPPPYGLTHNPRRLMYYGLFDGPYAGETDCHYLSVGIATYDYEEISVKAFRRSKSSGRWSRESEELPIHRCIDLALFALYDLFGAKGSDCSLRIPAGTFEKQTEDLLLECLIPSEEMPRNIDYALLAKRFLKLYEILEQHKEILNKVIQKSRADTDSSSASG